MKSVNERMRDAALVHLINLQRLANGYARKTLSTLALAEADIAARLAAAIDRMGPERFTVQRLAAQLEAVWEVNERTYRQLSRTTTSDMRKLTEYELDHQERTFNSLLPDAAAQRVTVLDPQTVYNATAARPFRGRLLKDWFNRLAFDQRERIATTLNVGFVNGKTVDEMIREVRGTRSQNYQDGILSIDRRNAEAVVRTATSHTAAFARQRFYKANEDLIKEERWVSTLDSRTTPECQTRDGLKYTAGDHEPIGHKVPWLEGPGAIHWNCRSTSVPVIDAAASLGLELPPLERAAMNGVAAPGTTFKDWIESQPTAVQDRVLGVTRAREMRAGKISFTKFFNDKGEWLTLEELREMERM